MLLGEQAVPIAKRLMAKAPVVAYLKAPECAGQVLGPQAVASSGFRAAVAEGPGMNPLDRRQAVALGAAFLSSSAFAQPRRPGMTDLLLVNAKITTLDPRQSPAPRPRLIRDGKLRGGRR
jgi:hypothetical protein